MTLNGAIKQLHELRLAENVPIYYKLVIAEVINVLLMDTQEVKHGRWMEDEYGIPHCSECKAINNTVYRNYCPNCGARMDDVEENE